MVDESCLGEVSVLNQLEVCSGSFSCVTMTPKAMKSAGKLKKAHSSKSAGKLKKAHSCPDLDKPKKPRRKAPRKITKAISKTPCTKKRRTTTRKTKPSHGKSKTKDNQARSSTPRIPRAVPLQQPLAPADDAPKLFNRDGPVDLRDVDKWPQQNAKCCWNGTAEGNSRQTRFQSNMNIGLDVDTDCSGIAGIETWMKMSGQGARDHGLAVPPKALYFHSATEIDAKRLAVLCAMPDGPAHVFKDLRVKVHPRALEHLERLRPPASI